MAQAAAICDELSCGATHDAALHKLRDAVLTVEDARCLFDMAVRLMGATPDAEGKSAVTPTDVNRVDAFHVLLKAYPLISHELVAHPFFWRLLHWGLRQQEAFRIIRKTAMSMFRHALKVARAVALTLGGAAGGLEALDAHWDLLCTIHDALEDFPLYMLVDVWGQVPQLLRPALATAAAGSAAATADGVPPADVAMMLHFLTDASTVQNTVAAFRMACTSARPRITVPLLGGYGDLPLATGSAAAATITWVPFAVPTHSVPVSTSPAPGAVVYVHDATLMAPLHIPVPYIGQLTAATTTGSGAPAPSSAASPTVPMEWAFVLIDRAFAHDNPVVRRGLLQRTLLADVRFDDEHPQKHCLDDDGNPMLMDSCSGVCARVARPLRRVEGSFVADDADVAHHRFERLAGAAPEVEAAAACGATAQRLSSDGSNAASLLAPRHAAHFASVAAASRPAAAAAGAASSGAPASSAAAAGKPPVSPQLPVGLLFPPWVVFSSYGMVRYCNDSALFRGVEDQLGRALQRYITTYLRRIAAMDATAVHLATIAAAAAGTTAAPAVLLESLDPLAGGSHVDPAVAAAAAISGRVPTVAVAPLLSPYADADSAASHVRVPLMFTACMRMLLPALFGAVDVRSVSKRALKALTQLQLPMSLTTVLSAPLPAEDGKAAVFSILDAPSLVHLRTLMVALSFKHLRSFIGERMRDALALVLQWGRAAALPLSDVFTLLGSFPASMTLQPPLIAADAARGAASSASVALPPVLLGESPVVPSTLNQHAALCRWLQVETAGGVAGVLRDSVAAYLDPTPASTTVPSGAIQPWTAAALARFVYVLPDEGALPEVLAPLQAALADVNRPYARASTRHSALLLLLALGNLRRPEKRLADSHMSSFADGDGAPGVQNESFANPLHREYAAAARCVSFPPAMAVCQLHGTAISTVPDDGHYGDDDCTLFGTLPAAGNQDDIAAAGATLRAALAEAGVVSVSIDAGASSAAASTIGAAAAFVRNPANDARSAAIAELLWNHPSIAGELMTHVEAGVREALLLSQHVAASVAAGGSGLLVWGPDTGLYRSQGALAGGSSFFMFGVASLLQLLRHALEVTTRPSADGSGTLCARAEYADGALRLLGAAVSRLHATASSDGSAVSLIEQCSSLQLVTSLLSLLSTSLRVVLPLLEPSGVVSAAATGDAAASSAASVPGLVSVEGLLRVLVSASFRKPAGASTDLPAVPVFVPATAATAVDDGAGDVAAATALTTHRGGRATWQELRSFFETCRFAAIAQILHSIASSVGPSTAFASTARPLTVLGLPADLVDATLQCVLDSLDSAQDDYFHILLLCAAPLLRACKSRYETHDEYVTAVTRYYTGAPSAPASSRITPVASELEPVVKSLRMSSLPKKAFRRIIAAYAACIIQAPLFARPLLHATRPAVDAAAGSGGAAAGGSDAIGDCCIRVAVAELLDRMGDEQRPVWGVQVPTARLVAVWSHLVLRLDGAEAAQANALLLLQASGGATIDAVASALAPSSPLAGAATALRCVLHSYVPIMMHLAMHREQYYMADDPSLVDAAARSQLGRWMKRWLHSRDGTGPKSNGGYWRTSIVSPWDSFAADGADELPDSIDIDSAADAPLVASSTTDADVAAMMVSLRGCGATTRVQVLFFLERLTQWAATARGRLMHLMTAVPAFATALAAATAPSTPTGTAAGAVLAGRLSPLFDPAAVCLQRVLILRLLAFHSLAPWRKECGPGTAGQGAKLRCWQALTLLIAHWGVASSPATGTGGVAPGAAAPATASTDLRAPGGLVYDASRDLYLPQDAYVPPPIVASADCIDVALLYKLAPLSPSALMLLFPTAPAAGSAGIAASASSSAAAAAASAAVPRKPKRIAAKDGGVAMTVPDDSPTVGLVGPSSTPDRPIDVVFEATATTANEASSEPLLTAALGHSGWVRDDMLAAAYLAFVSRDVLSTVQLPSTKNYMEITLAALAHRFPHAFLHTFAVPLLREWDLRGQMGISALTVAGLMSLHFLAMVGASPPAQPPLRKLQASLLATTGTTATSPLAAVKGPSESGPNRDKRVKAAAQEAIALDKALAGKALVSLPAAAGVPELTAAQREGIMSVLDQVLMLCLPWSTCNVGLVRILSNTIVMWCAPAILPHLFDPATGMPHKPAVLPPSGRLFGAGTSHGADASAAGFWMLPLLNMLFGSSEIVAMAYKQAPHLLALHPSTTASLQSILTARSDEHGELIPVDVFSRLKDSVTSLSTAIHVIDPYGWIDEEMTHEDTLWAMKTGLAPRTALWDDRLAVGYRGEADAATAAAAPAAGGAATAASDGGDAASPAGAAFNFQRKFTSAVAMTGGTPTAAGAAGAAAAGGSGGAGASSIAPALAALIPPFEAPKDLHVVGDAGRGSSTASSAGAGETSHAMVAALRARTHPALTHTDGAGRKCQPLIILASLLDKATNLGGLARTSEIFAAEGLVVPDMRVRADQHFKDVSVSAGEWMNMHECKAEHMVRYIREKRAQGYTVVGLEQAARSKRLGDVAFPEKVVLVLGAELRGMPAEVIQELDIVIEIPQLGLIRSLNVHVSASLCIWEYTRQRLGPLPAAAAAAAAAALADA